MPAALRLLRTCAFVVSAILIGTAAAHAQANADPTPQGTLTPAPLPPLADPNSPTTPAKELFARKTEPSAGPARSIGGYADGCLSGGAGLPISGPNWQVELCELKKPYRGRLCTVRFRLAKIRLITSVR